MKQYENPLYIFYTIMICVIFIISIFILTKKYSYKNECTPSQDMQWLSQQIKDLEQSQEMMVQEVCWLPISNLVQVLYASGTTDQTYCNSVWCRGSEQAYKDWDKMSNDNPQKWMYVDEQWRKNYFDRTKFK